MRPPLMSNVRPRRERQPSSIEREFTAMHPRLSSTQHRSPSKALVRSVSHTTVQTRTSETRSAAVPARAVARKAEHARTSEIPFQSAAALEAPPRVNVGQFVGAGAVAPARLARSRSQCCRFRRSGPVVVASAVQECWRRARPNPSIEGTSTSKRRFLAAAPHFNR